MSHTSLIFELERAAGCAVLVGVAVSPTFLVALQVVVRALQARNPKATDDQLLDMIFARGVIGFTEDLNLPRVDANPDEDA